MMFLGCKSLKGLAGHICTPIEEQPLLFMNLHVPRQLKNLQYLYRCTWLRFYSGEKKRLYKSSHSFSYEVLIRIEKHKRSSNLFLENTVFCLKTNWISFITCHPFFFLTGCSLNREPRTFVFMTKHSQASQKIQSPCWVGPQDVSVLKLCYVTLHWTASWRNPHRSDIFPFSGKIWLIFK